MMQQPKPGLDGRPDEGHGLTYPCGEAPESGHGREIAPGVRWLRMHLPWALAHINLYALADDGGWAIVDTGAQTREALANWTRALAAEDALGGQRITRVFVTHMHPDHSNGLTDNNGAAIFPHGDDVLQAGDRVIIFTEAANAPWVVEAL